MSDDEDSLLIGSEGEPYSDLGRSFPKHLSQMTGRRGESRIVEIVIFDFVVPRGGGLVT